MITVVPTDISLKTTTVAANSEAEWDDVTTYIAGDQVKVTSVEPHMVYESLRGSNLDKNPADHLEPELIVGTSVTSRTVGTGSLVFTTQTGLGFVAGMVVEITKTATPNSVNMTGEVTAYVTGTGSITINVYSVTGAGTHTDWTITSVDEVGFWKEISATNQYKMFDGYINTQTEDVTEIDVKINVERGDYLALFGLVGNDVDIELWDTTETTLYWSTTIDLLYANRATENIADWYEYFFGELTRLEDTNVPIEVVLYEGVLRITISADTDEPVAIGHVIVGRAFNIGDTQFSSSVGMLDFSASETDDLGRTKLEPGYWAKRNDLTVWVPNYLVDSVYRTLTSLRGVATAWIGNNDCTDFESMVVYGVFRDFEIVFQGNDHSVCEISITGLV